MADHTSKNGSKNADAHVGTLHSELEALESDMKKLAGDVESIADNRFHAALHKAEDVAHRAHHLADDVEAWAGNNLNSARRSIRAKPFSALALSAGVGALIGAILGFVGRKPPSASA